MIDKELIRKITEFVFVKPRTIQEIALLIKRNWRTADRYIENIASETGSISTRTFRGGTRGALKVVYANVLPLKGSAYQEKLLQKILQGKFKEDFSPLDIYQFVPQDKRKCFKEDLEYSTHPEIKYDEILKKANHQILFFSGNMSWLDLGPKEVILKQLGELSKKGISIKILTRVDIISRRNIERTLAMNRRFGYDAIEIRHTEQPLRAIIIDDKFASMKEVLNPSYRPLEITKKSFLFYLIEDPQWIVWLQRVFWHIFSQSVDAKQRLEAIDSVLE